MIAFKTFKSFPLLWSLNIVCNFFQFRNGTFLSLISSVLVCHMADHGVLYCKWYLRAVAERKNISQNDFSFSLFLTEYCSPVIDKFYETFFAFFLACQLNWIILFHFNGKAAWWHSAWDLCVSEERTYCCALVSKWSFLI